MSTCNKIDFKIDEDPDLCTQVDVGLHWSRPITLLLNGVAVNLTGNTYEMVIKDILGGTTLMTLPIVGNISTLGIYIPVPADGKMYLQILEADSTAAGAGVFEYEIIETDVNTFRSVFLNGTIQFYDRGF